MSEKKIGQVTVGFPEMKINFLLHFHRKGKILPAGDAAERAFLKRPLPVTGMICAAYKHAPFAKPLGKGTVAQEIFAHPVADL